jgi:hypothetical protein
MKRQLNRGGSSLFKDDVILYVQNMDTYTHEREKKLELVNEFSKVKEFKVNAQNSVAFLSPKNEQSEEEIKKMILFIKSLKKIM